jgi:hypothetical protein
MVIDPYAIHLLGHIAADEHLEYWLRTNVRCLVQRFGRVHLWTGRWQIYKNETKTKVPSNGLQFVDIAGSKSVFVFSAIVTCLYYAGVSQVHTFIGILFVQALRCGNHFDAGSEMYLVNNEIMGYGIHDFDKNISNI